MKRLPAILSIILVLTLLFTSISAAEVSGGDADKPGGVDALSESTGMVSITFNDNGNVNSYELTPGDALPCPDDIIDHDLTRHSFDGWYDSTFSVKYTAVPDSAMTLYAKYVDFWGYTFDSGAVYDPNSKGMLTAVPDPFGGDGKVLYTPVINKNDSVLYGYFRGLAPTVYDGISTAGFDFQKGRTYEVSFYYRLADDSPDGASCTLSVYAVDPAGVYVNGSKTQLTPTFVTSTSSLIGKGEWTLCRFRVTNTTDYAHLYLRFMGGSTTTAYDFYVDDLTIVDLTGEPGVKLVANGVTQSTELAVGDALPTLPSFSDDVTDAEYAFDGWYDQTLTTKYTAVDASVDTYYAKYSALSQYAFETGGIYDPNQKYASGNRGIAAWYRAIDPTDSDNICLRANLCSNGNNTHVAPSAVEGASEGYTLTAGKKYVLSFDYYVDSTEVDELSLTVRGAASANIGVSGGKTDTITSYTLSKVNQWGVGMFVFTAPDEVADRPYLLLLAQGSSSISDLMLYIDDLVIRELSADSDIVIYTPAENVTLNDNGVVNTYNSFHVGSALPDPENYYGAEFVGWYDEALDLPYATVQAGNTAFYAKFDGSVINFENGGYYDPNGNFGTGLSAYSPVADPTDSTNTVIKASLKNNANNLHFALNESGYSTDGYKLTVGNTYEISFKYYAEDLNANGVNVQFRGCKQANIGIAGGKSSGYGGKKLDVESAWTGVTVKFTYQGAGLDTEEDVYLTMLAQDGSQGSGNAACTAVVYFDDIVIKETEPEETFVSKTNKIGGWTLGYADRDLNIVLPSANFSYVAMLQCEELAEAIKGITTTSCDANIVFEDEWTEGSNQSNIFVGDVTGHSRDKSYKIDTSSFTKDDYAYCIGNGNIYIDGGSPYALAMGISELTKALTAAADGYEFPQGTLTTGKYSEKIGGYSTASYYRPTFQEDFDGDTIDTGVWSVMDGMEIQSVTEGKLSKRSAEHTYLENGKLVINAAFDENYYYGGMLRSHGKMEYRYGYLEISCVTPHGAGLWTSLWATPNGGTTGLYSSEIDINESFGDARYTAFNMHSWLTSAGYNLGYTKYSLDGRYSSAKRADAGEGNTFADGLHTFGYLWTETGAKFTVDGEVYFEYTYDPTSTYYSNDLDAFSEKLSLIVSMTVGNPGVSSQFDLDETADYWNTTNKYIVDYIHIYQIDGQNIWFTDTEAE